MRVAVYIRVSTQEQAQEGYSIKAQRKKLEAYALSQEWEIVQFYVDEGLSAKDMNRPELQRLLNNMEEGAFDCVLVYRLDRLTRSVLDLYEMIKKFEKHDIKFKSATEVYDTTTATGRLFVTIIASLAQWERENLGERVRFGLEQKAKEGKWALSTPPYGYDIENGYLKINDGEANTVKYIFDQYLKGRGMNQIVTDLNDNGTKTKSNSNWHQGSIRYILTNPAYIGTMRYNFRTNKENYFEVEDAIPPIIDKDLYETVQEIRNTRAQLHPRAANSDYVFSGIAKCKRCGAPLFGKTSKKVKGDKTYLSKSYKCSNVRRGMCDQPTITDSFLEEQFHKILSIWDFSKNIKKIQGTDLNTELDEQKLIRRQLSDVNKRRSKWQYAWVNNMISDEDLSKRLQEETQKEEELNQKLELIQGMNNNSKGPSKQFINDMVYTWNKLTAKDKKKLLHLTVKEFKVDKISKKRLPTSVEVSDIIFN
ncbi:recombinase family protein [Alkalihalophilus marmarensis]|uniref:Resolvase n=1 Tax=Alkalihalophilus marmarensis DSM 21297 TaxID=1188261 RepID=U6SQ72_9BACI|nr:recombinase family protein [Alkalihalophilus marmarensis]ERN52801.1 resolvase [Alkalihalophilus marmarensis DSM 21297]MCM3489109.1 recombinase family protein [Alkalihalophilus marmarensis]